MPHETIAFECNFCRRVSRTKAGAERHECACKYNPARRACHTCEHCDLKAEIKIKVTKEEKEEFYELYDIDADDYATFRGMYCKHFGKPISKKPYFEECEHYDWPDEETPMPGTCFYWEPKEEKEKQPYDHSENQTV